MWVLLDHCWTTSHNTEYTLRHLSVLLKFDFCLPYLLILEWILVLFMSKVIKKIIMATLASLWRTTLQLLSGLNTCNKKNNKKLGCLYVIIVICSFIRALNKKRKQKDTASGDKKKVQIYTPALSKRLKIRASAKHSKTKQQRWELQSLKRISVHEKKQVMPKI